MDLLCCESIIEIRAYEDPVLVNDDRFLSNLLKAEERYSPSNTYFQRIQTELTPKMRKIVADWMLEVCESEKCQVEVFALSINYLDRFLSVCPITKNQLQLLASTTLFLASKLRETQPISAQLLSYYADYSISPYDILDWEQMVLSKLRWDILAVTPQDFLILILRRLPVDEENWNWAMILHHAQTLIALSLSDFAFSTYTPSMIACASLAAALAGLDWSRKSGYSVAQLLDELQRITAIKRYYLQSCLQKIENMIQSGMMLPKETSSLSGNGADPRINPTPTLTNDLALKKLGEPLDTPNDVMDVHF